MKTDNVSFSGISGVILIGLFLNLTGCQEKEIPKVFPKVVTGEITSITDTSALCGGVVLSEGTSGVIMRGVKWSTDSTFSGTYPDGITYDGSGPGHFASYISINIQWILSDTKYFVRAYATNHEGTGYGDAVAFRTKHMVVAPVNFNPSVTYDSITDQDGNVYKTVTIGTQIWMAENLRTTRYNYGSYIAYIEDVKSWLRPWAAAYCWYNNDKDAVRESYGALYNWYAVSTMKLCPVGWHVPSSGDWDVLFTFLGGYEIAGGKMKESGTSHWRSPNSGATNESGFTALPAGDRGYNQGNYGSIRDRASWWSSEGVDWAGLAFCLNYADSSVFYWGFDKFIGYSVRCIKDN